MLTLHLFRNYVRQWASHRINDFKYYWPLKGGWELWIQVDLMAHIFRHHHLSDILREQPIYRNPKQKVDLLLNALGAPENCIPVEIKAQSLENHSKIFADVVKDKLKLEGERKPAYSQCQCIQLVFVFHDDDLGRIKDIRNRDGHRIFSAILSTSEIAILCAALDRDGNWLPAHHFDLEMGEPA